MRQFYIDKIKIMDTWCKQNDGETVDGVDGCLLDNFVVACRRGWAFVYEHYLNPWASNYLVKFVPYKDEDGCRAAWDEWETFREEVEKETA